MRVSAHRFGWLVLAALALVPSQLNGQTRGSGTIGLNATLVRSVDVNSDAAAQIRNTSELARVLVVRDGRATARRGFALYRAGDHLVVRNGDPNVMGRDIRVRHIADGIGESIRIEMCDCPDKSGDDCEWSWDSEARREVCGGDPDQCCEESGISFDLFWTEE